MLSQRDILFTNPAQPRLQILGSTDTKLPTYFPSKQPLCCNMAAVCFCWCEAPIYSGHADKQGEQLQCSRAAWQVVQNVLTVHSRRLDLTKTDTLELLCLEAFLLPFPPLNIYTAVSTKPVLRKAHNVSLTLHVLNC